jgi:hypothetical protein
MPQPLTLPAIGSIIVIVVRAIYRDKKSNYPGIKPPRLRVRGLIDDSRHSDPAGAEVAVGRGPRLRGLLDARPHPAYAVSRGRTTVAWHRAGLLDD